MGRNPLGLLIVGAAILLASCAPSPQASNTAPAPNSAPAQPAAKKRVVAAVNGNLFTVSGMLSVGGTGTATQGTSEVEKLTNAGFTTKGLTQPLEAQLAETVHTIDNSNWKVAPDGRMEMTWKIRAGSKWQDGQPVTADDVVFTAMIGQDAELAFVRDRKYREIEGIDAPDPQTVVVRWRQTDIEADQMFGTGGTLPLPKHLLEDSYNSNKATFLQQGFWSSDFVGSGPYRVANWQDGIGTLLVANDGYALGRPKIDEIEVKFISNSPTEVANILAGAVELTFGRGLSQDQAATLREQWKDGTVQVYGSNPNIITPQHLNPTPAIVSNLQFRKALWYALNRPEMAAALTAGLGVVANTGVTTEPIYKDIDTAAVQYPYDPRQAMQIIEGLGYKRAADGIYQDPSGTPVKVEIRSTDKDVNVKSMLAIATYWQQVGVATDQVAIPAARQADLEYRATFPAFDTGGTFGMVGSLNSLNKSEMRLPTNGYQGTNRGNYINPDLENTINQYYLTIPIGPRFDLLKQIYHTITDQVVVIYMYYDVDPVAVGNRVQNVSAAYFGNVQAWDVQS